MRFRSTNRDTAIIVAALVVGLCGRSMALPPYSFTRIADDTGPFETFFTPQINNHGRVVFVAVTDSLDVGVHVGDGGPLTTIADNSGVIRNFACCPSINDAGTVAFSASPTAGGAAIYSGNGGPLALRVDSSGPFGIFGAAVGINNSNEVAFWANTDAGGEGIYRISATGGLTTIADDAGPFDSFPSSLSLNESGRVAFTATMDSGVRGVYSGTGGPTATIADNTGPLDGFFGAAINDGGEVGFAASGPAVYTGSGGPLTLVADDSGAYFQFDAPALNHVGDVVFFASLDAGGEGIFFGDDAVVDKLIQVGDPLDGSIVTNLPLTGGPKELSVNEMGQVVFRADLADGRRGLYRADPIPEPHTLVLLMLAGGAFLWRRQRLQHHQCRRTGTLKKENSRDVCYSSSF